MLLFFFFFFFFYSCQNETLTDDGESQAYQTELDRIKQELQETKVELQKQQEAYKLLKQVSSEIYFLSSYNKIPVFWQD